MGLINTVAPDPETAALAWFGEHLEAASSSSLRFAVRAAREAMRARVERRLDEVETLYLEELMATHDAVEGLNAFLEKRTASWEHR